MHNDTPLIYKLCIMIKIDIHTHILPREWENLEKKYRVTLINSIKNFWSEKTQKKLKLQRESINQNYSWDLRVLEWKKFFDSIRASKR